MTEPTILTAICIGLTESAKRAGLPSRFAPIASLLIGVGFNFGFKFIGVETGELIIGGVVAGLTAAGLYSGVKKTAGN